MPACIATISNSQKIIEFIFYKYFPSFNTICNDKSCNNIVMTSIYIKIIKQIVLLHTTTYTLCGLIQHTWAKGFYHMHTYTYTHRVYTYTQTHRYTHVHTQIHTRTQAHTHASMYTHIHTGLYTDIHTGLCTRTHAHARPHTHMHFNILTNKQANQFMVSNF